MTQKAMAREPDSGLLPALSHPDMLIHHLEAYRNELT